MNWERNLNSGRMYTPVKMYHVVVYPLIIVANGDGLLEKFVHVVLGSVLRTMQTRLLRIYYTEPMFR